VEGTKASFKWTLIENDPHVIHTAKKQEPESAEEIKVPDFSNMLPESIRKFTLQTKPRVSESAQCTFV
jgi:hypothetical protein